MVQMETGYHGYLGGGREYSMPSTTKQRYNYTRGEFMPTDKICFVIAPIRAPDSATRKRSDQVLKYIIKPAAEECGFTTLRADEIPKPGIITSQVIEHIIDDAMLVADLTEHNANVFYELAIRHAIRRPYVQIIEDSELLPFDVSGVRSIKFTYRDLDSVEFAKNEIIKQMRSNER